MNKKIELQFSIVTGFILIAAFSRLIPHPPNFAPIGGMALFGAAYYNRRIWSYFIPIASMWLSDLLLNNVIYARYFEGFVWFYRGSFFTYGAFVLIVLMGSFTLRRIRIVRLIFSALGASAIFFAISNFGVWMSSGMYPHSWEGLAACYAAGIPFFKNTFMGDLFYSAGLFGLFELSKAWFPRLNVSHRT